MLRPAALITGSTSGIGVGYARDGYDVILVARDVDRLTQLADELQNEAGCTEILPADLSDLADCDKVADRLRAGVRVLVNNADFGTSGEFWTADLFLDGGSVLAAGPARRQCDRGDAADSCGSASYAPR